MSNPFQKIREALRKSKVDDILGTVLAETPVGKVGRVIKGISDILGTDDSEDSVVAAIEAGVSPEQAVQLREFAARELEALEETKRNENDNITARHAADMMSDSWLSKNVRPLAFISLIATTIFVVVVVVLTFAVSNFYDNPLDEKLWDNALMVAVVGGLFTLTANVASFYVVFRTKEKKASFEEATRMFLNQ